MGNRNNEIIELSLPVNAAYVSAARLTASSIVNRLGFGIDEIEDVKAAVSEACTLLIKLIPTDSVQYFKVCFEPGEQSITVRIRAEQGFPFVPDEGEMSLMVIRALMDTVEITRSGNGAEMRMVKWHSKREFL